MVISRIIDVSLSTPCSVLPCATATQLVSYTAVLFPRRLVVTAIV